MNIKDFKANPPAPRPDWNDQKNKLKKKFPELTEDDMHQEFGKKDETIARIQSKLGLSSEEFQKVLESL